MDTSPIPRLRPPEPIQNISYDDLEKIERVVAAEAGTEGSEGRNAVRGVIFNRLASKRFGNTVDDVLTADQFEPVRKYGSVEDIPVDQDQLYDGVEELIDYIQLGEDASGGRVFFQNEAVTKKRGSYFEGTNPLKIGNHTFYDGIKGQDPVTMTDLVGSHNIRFMDDLASADPGMRLGGLMEARKGITTEAGLDMAREKFQIDRKKADLNDDGDVSEYEEARAEAVQKATAEDEEEALNMYHGGMPCGCGEGLMGEDPVSGNPIPVGSTAENVRDDISIMISEGEYVLPANVVKWVGLKHIMDMQAEAEMGLMGMHSMGLIQEVDTDEDQQDEPSSEDIEDTEVQASDDTEQEETETIETPEGNEIEVADGVEVEEEVMDPEYPDEDDENYYPTKTQMYGMMKKPTIKFII